MHKLKLPWLMKWSNDFIFWKARPQINFWVFKNSAKYAYQGLRNVRFSENLACFVFLLPPFWDSPFYFITDKLVGCISRKKKGNLKSVAKYLLSCHKTVTLMSMFIRDSQLLKVLLLIVSYSWLYSYDFLCLDREVFPSKCV